ncbi:MAG TPA: hypothetical protein VFS71_07295 [Flavobacterium sp.]|uniref:hypothetical protein n=1 Tax=Flavobacterium sp. TaxID=239 RepID=UPI002DBACBEF|nr:hypothetical protein [Flavobacterium sp.]HEU4789473.1 hypothetical protein [Flavobacterium sp.]
MKKYIKQIVALALIVSFASCSPDDEKVDMLSAGGSAVAPGSISRLDTNVPLTVKLKLKEGVTVTKVEIYRNIAANSTAAIILGDKVSDATVVTVDNANATATYSSSTLGSFDVFPVTGADGKVTLTGKTGTFPLAIKSTFSDGTVTTTPYVQTVGKGIVWKDADANTISTSGVSSFKLNDPTPVKISFAPVKKTATTLTSIVGTWTKTTADGTVTTGNLPGTIDATIAPKTIDIAAIPYSTYGGLVAGDVIVYKFTVTAGTQTDSISTKVTVADQVFGGSSTGSLSQDLSMNQFSFATAKTYASDSSEGEIVFNPEFGFAKAGDTRIEFVENSGLVYDDANLFDAEIAFNAGTPVTTLTEDLFIDSVVLYKVTRNVNLGTKDEPDFQDVTYYGLLKVTDLSLSSSELIQGFKFTYKEGELVQ